MNFSLDFFVKISLKMVIFLDFLVFDHHYDYHDNHRLCNAKKCERCENVKNRFLFFFNFETQD